LSQLDYSRRELLAKAAGGGLMLGFGGLSGCAGQIAADSFSAAAIPTHSARKAFTDVDPEATRRFVGTLKGRAIAPGDPDYESSRRVWNAAFDRRPGLIILCADPTDVVRAVEFAQRQEILTTVRSGGHSLAGKSTCDGGLILDLSMLKQIEVDADARVARAGAGTLLGEFDAATAARGLATTTGTEPSTGIAGLTLGGGLGWLMGKYGLACDNLRSVDVVLADGRLVKASATSNPDLFWAMRGAGANFGVVTAFEYELHPVDTILAGVIKLPFEQMGNVLRRYREFSEGMPDEVGLSVGTLPTRQGKPIASLAVSYCGDLQEGEKVLRPLRQLSSVLSDDIRPVPYRAFQLRGGLPPGLRLGSFTRSSFLNVLDDAAIDAIVDQAVRVLPMAGNFVIERVHGRACRLAPTATSFPHRVAGHNFSVHGTWVQPAGEVPATQWALAFWQAMQPFVSSAVYSNYLGDEGGERARASYGINYSRLVALKRTYDPANFFSANQNIAHLS